MRVRTHMCAAIQPRFQAYWSYSVGIHSVCKLPRCLELEILWIILLLAASSVYHIYDDFILPWIHACFLLVVLLIIADIKRGVRFPVMSKLSVLHVRIECPIIHNISTCSSDYDCYVIVLLCTKLYAVCSWARHENEMTQNLMIQLCMWWRSSATDIQYLEVSIFVGTIVGGDWPENMKFVLTNDAKYLNFVNPLPHQHPIHTLDLQMIVTLKYKIVG